MLDQLQSVFASFQRNDVKYLVIGGIAAVLYGVPRATFDLDVLIEPTNENAERLLRAMTEAGLGTASLRRLRFLPIGLDWMFKHPRPGLPLRNRGCAE